MSKHFNVGEAKAKLSQLIAAARRGEDVVIDNDGTPQVRLVTVDGVDDSNRIQRAARRQSAAGMWVEAFRGWQETDIGRSMTDAEVETRWRRKFDPAS